MKFKKPEKYHPWTLEQTQERINQSWSEIKKFNQKMNEIDRKIVELLDKKKQIRSKVSNKHKYIKQLKIQCNEPEQEA